jgi:hypothetical protein
MGILFDLLVDAACKVAGFFVSTMGELLFPLSSGTDSPDIAYEGTRKQQSHSLSGHSTVAR